MSPAGNIERIIMLGKPIHKYGVASPIMNPPMMKKEVSCVRKWNHNGRIVNVNHLILRIIITNVIMFII